MPLLGLKKEGKTLVIELQRSQQGNALNRQLQRELAAAWQELEDSDDVLIGVIHGGNAVFSIGHDVEELAHGQGPEASPIPENALFPLNLSKPVIAAIEGPCYGLGFELALSCDIRVAGHGALFGCPDQNLFVPYRVASVLLPRMAFNGLSLDLLLSGKVLDAAQAQQARLAQRVAPKGQALSVALDAARAMARRFPTTGAFKKRRVWRLSGVPMPHAQTIVREPA